MAVKSTYTLEFKKYGYLCTIAGAKEPWIIAPLADGKGWVIVRDRSLKPYATPEEAAEELLRQFENERAGAQR